MQSKIKSLLFTAAAAISLFTSCAPDNDNNLLDDRDKFTGSWTVQDSGSVSGASTYTVTIDKAGGDTLKMFNFYALGSSIYTYAVVSGTSIVVPGQVVDGIQLNGSGTYSNDKFSIAYSAPTLGDNGTAKFSK